MSRAKKNEPPSIADFYDLWKLPVTVGPQVTYEFDDPPRGLNALATLYRVGKPTRAVTTPGAYDSLAAAWADRKQSPAYLWLEKHPDFQQAKAEFQELRQQAKSDDSRPPISEADELRFVKDIAWCIAECMLEERSPKKALTKRQREQAVGHIEGLANDFEKGVRLFLSNEQAQLDSLLAKLYRELRNAKRQYSGTKAHGRHGLEFFARGMLMAYHDCPPVMLEYVASLCGVYKDHSTIKDWIRRAKSAAGKSSNFG